jgi:hypothetical protein
MNYNKSSKEWEKIRIEAADRLLRSVKANLRNGEFATTDEKMAKAINVRVDTLKRVITQAKEMKTISTYLKDGLRVYRLFEPEPPKPKSVKLF